MGSAQFLQAHLQPDLQPLSIFLPIDHRQDSIDERSIYHIQLIVQVHAQRPHYNRHYTVCRFFDAVSMRQKSQVLVWTAHCPLLVFIDTDPATDAWFP